MHETLLILLLFVIISILGSLIYLKRTESYDRNSKIFEPSLASQCKGGAYMYTSNKSLSQACKNAPYSDTLSVCKRPGFQGQPLTFEYLNLSNNKWKNSLACGPYGPLNDPENIHALPAIMRGIVGPPLRPLQKEDLVHGKQICIL